MSSFTYTADGERLVRRDPGATTVYLPGGQELTATTEGGVTATRYYTAGGTTVAVRTETDDPVAFPFGQVDVIAADPHGTGQVAFNTHTGGVARRYTDPYGTTLGATGTWAGDRGFLDKPVDATGYVHVGARYYDPAKGRFLSVDPVMDLTDPAQWHAYAYANNNPITYSDPTGLKPQQHDGQVNAGKWKPRYTPGYTPAVRPPVRTGGVDWGRAAGAVGNGLRRIGADIVNGMPIVMMPQFVGQITDGTMASEWNHLTNGEGSYWDKAGSRWSGMWTGVRDHYVNGWEGGGNYFALEEATYLLPALVAGKGISAANRTAAARAAANTARTEAEAYASALLAAEGRTPTMASAAVDARTGTISLGHSGEALSAPPALTGRLPSTTLEPWSVTNCAEVAAVSRAMQKGARLSDLAVWTVRTRTGRYEPPCANCSTWLPGS